MGRRKPTSSSYASAGRAPGRLAQACGGYTLIELVLTLVLLGAIATVLLPFFNAITHSADPELRAKAVSLGQAMMDEIMSKRWDENTPVGGGPVVTGETPAPTPACVADPCSCPADRISRFVCRDSSYAPGTASTILGPEEANRTDYDDVDDYNGLNEPDGGGNFLDQNGSTFAMPGFTRTVTVQYIASNANPIAKDTPAAAAGTTTDTKLIIVRVTSPLGETLELVGIKCNL